MKGAGYGSTGHYENFPVGSILLPSPMRPHVLALYAFARAADDFADEGVRTEDERYRLLDGWLRRLDLTFSGGGEGGPPTAGEPADAEQIFAALGRAIREKDLPRELLEALLSAFRQDVAKTRYASWDELLDYCRRSANPVGRLVLRIAGVRDDRCDRMSDDICTALQLTNFWQDLHVDFCRGRIYLPADVLRAQGAGVEDLLRGDLTPEWCRALADVTSRTRGLFEDGRPLCNAVSGRLKYELRATWLGGIRILDRIAAAGYDVVSRRPALGPADFPWFTYRMLAWRTGSEPRLPSRTRVV